MLGITISWKSLLIGFILFRFFDIVKPWPIKLLDKHVKGGFGIMVDDIFAGFASLLCLHFLVYLGLI
jgi:phosphatidylglycerophosphatase A